MPEPTEAQAQKYADYSVEIHESNHPCSIGESDGGPIRIYMRAYRVASKKRFEVFIRKGASLRERRNAVEWGSQLPSGSWAAISAEKWFRCTRAGSAAYWQSVGTPVADPLLELEIEEFRDTDLDFELEHMAGALS
jgi:hypothetical protein